MRAAKKAKFDKKILHDLVPLNALSESSFGKMAEKILVEEVKAGHYLFRKGDRDGKSVYLLEGKVDLIDGFRKITGEVVSGSDMARYPIANLQPRSLSARAAKKSVIARIDSNMLDVFLTCDQTQAPDVVEISGADTGDWMTRVLQSEVFSKLPPAKIQSLLIRMKPFSLKAGEVVIHQGDEGDYFYTIHEGRCAVTRRQMPDGEDVLLAELGDGDSFGDDALVSNTRRNATVTMLTDGTLMRLAKQDFVELLKKQLVRHIDRKTACAMVEEGAVWLDVRTPEEYDRGSFEDSVNIPLAGLRDELSELVFNATYILCCDTGGRSGAAAFMLSHKGYDVYVLEGGIASLTPDELEAAGMPLQHASHHEEPGSDCAEAEVISFGAGRCDPSANEESEEVTVTDVDDSVLGAAGTDSGQADMSPEQDRRLAELRQEKASLLEDLENHRDTEQRLKEQLELLRAELGEAGEKLGELYSQAKADAEEKQQLRDQFTSLQTEFTEKQQAYEGRQDAASRRIEELQSQLDSVRQESQAGTEAVSNDLVSAQADNDRLREELAAAVERTGLLEAELDAALEAESRHENEAAGTLKEQQDRMQLLQEELERLGQENAQLQQQLATASDQEHSTSHEWQSRLLEMENRFAGLTGDLEGVRKELEEKDAELSAESARVRELDQANRDLHDSLASAQRSITQLEEQAGSAVQEQQAHTEELRTQLTGTLDANEQLRHDLEEALTARDRAREELQTRLDEVAGHAVQAGGELADLQLRLGESADRLAAEQERSEHLQQEYNEQARVLENLHAELDRARGEHESFAVASAERQQALEDELSGLRRELADVTERSREAVSGLESTAETVQTLERYKETLNAALQEAESGLAKQVEHAAILEKEKQEAIDALAVQRETNDAEHQALIEQLEAVQQANAQLQADLESGLQESRAQSEDALARLQAEQQELQQKLAAQEEEKAGLLARVAALDEKYATELAEKDSQIVELQESSRSGQEEIDGLLQVIEEKNSLLEELQKEIGEREGSRKLIEEQLETSREQNRQLRLEMEQTELHAREAEEEYQDAVRKAHDDLTRKNDNEKELQGQIDRLRKQLEQATLDQHKQREDAQDNLDHIREQLHAERRARAEERADMAARQRELKEQLASIAVEHEANLGNRSGTLDDARDAIRAEEQERLREVLEAQAQTEDLIHQLQQELYKAHEEISELTRQQKSVRQADIELLQEQNQQAVSTIAQLESQLKQLSDERDSALEEQNGMRERMNALRGEVEVARGLMNMHGQAENPARLMSELDEAKKNVEIAVRLRAEAEAARDRVLRERDQLREQLASDGAAKVHSHAPASIKLPAGKALKTRAVPGVDKPAEADRSRQADASSATRESQISPEKTRNRRLGLVIGLGGCGIIALVTWLMIGVGNPLRGVISAFSQPDEVASGDIPGQDGDDVSLVKGVYPPPVVAESPQVPARQTVTAPAEQPDNNTADKEVEAAPVAAVRSYRDVLGGGIKGPLMTELPAATYRMGSPGNSLNYDESPRHEVSLPGFSISKYEVTFAEYDRFARATGRRLPYDEDWGRGNRPVINVSWKDAQAYTEWLSSQTGKSYRLPTEAEWEYAIRAGSTSRHWWEDEQPGVYANCFDCGSEWDNARTAPAGSFPANRFGLYDMAGNVQEWTQDCYQSGYADAPADGSAVLTPECTQRSVRGGGYTSPLDSLRSAKRAQYDQDTRLDNIGFRVVRDN